MSGTQRNDLQSRSSHTDQGIRHERDAAAGFDGGNPLYVAAVMNSMIGRWQTRMLVTGSAQVELYSGDIRRFVIPFIGKKGEEEVASAIKGAHAARARVRELLDRAKRAVGIAIKQDEKAAMESLEK